MPGNKSYSVEQKRLRNRAARTLSKTKVSKAENLIQSGEMEPAKQSTAAAIKILDRTAERGIIHPNNAARRKSRLMKKLNAAQAKAKETKS